MVLVLDSGSHTVKAGRSGQLKPGVTVRSVVAERPVSAAGSKGGAPSGKKRRLKKKYICGYEVIAEQAKKSDLKVVSPLRAGIPRDLEGCEALWAAAARKLELRTKETDVLLGIRPLMPKLKKQLTAQLMFERLGVRGLYVADTALLSMYAQGRLNGVVMDVGYDQTLATAVIDGQSFAPSCVRADVGGNHVTQYLAALLSGKTGGAGSSGGAITKQLEFVYERIKAQHCYVAESYLAEYKRARDYKNASSGKGKHFKLPDGRMLAVAGSPELCQAPEALFRPELLSGAVASAGDFRVAGEGGGISTLLQSCIQKCDPAIKPELYKEMVITGQSSQFPGLQRRLQAEMVRVMPATVTNSSSNYRIHSPPNRSHTAYTGGAILASLPIFEQIKMSRADYNECGPSLVDRKCV